VFTCPDIEQQKRVTSSKNVNDEAKSQKSFKKRPPKVAQKKNIFIFVTH